MTCAEVTWDTAVFVDRSIPELRVGSLVWNPKDCDDHGHVLTGEVTCGEDDNYCGYCGGFCTHDMWVCECGKVDINDHHTMFDAAD